MTRCDTMRCYSLVYSYTHTQISIKIPQIHTIQISYTQCSRQAPDTQATHSHIHIYLCLCRRFVRCPFSFGFMPYEGYALNVYVLFISKFMCVRVCMHVYECAQYMSPQTRDWNCCVSFAVALLYFDNVSLHIQYPCLRRAFTQLTTLFFFSLSTHRHTYVHVCICKITNKQTSNGEGTSGGANKAKREREKNENWK